MTDEELKKAAEEYAYKGIPEKWKLPLKSIGDEVIKHFIAGAEWGAELFRDTTKMMETPVSDDLEEAAVDIADSLLTKPKDYALSAKADYWNGAHDGVIAGAEWQKQHDAELIEIAYNDGITIGMTKQKEQDLAEMAQSKSPLSVAYANRCFENGKQAMKEQMMKEAIDCVVCAGTEWNKLVITYLGDYESMVNTCKHGDRVRIIIIKDDGKSD